MLTRVDRDTIAAILGPDWERFEAPPPKPPEPGEKSERNIDTPEPKPEQ
jgi:hypothetical protein